MNPVQDLKTALRTLAKRPGFTLMVVAILGLGMGATTAVFDLTNLLAWRTLPVEDANQLVHVFTAMDRGFVGPHHPTSYPDYLDYRDGNSSFSGLAAHQDLDLRLDTGEVTQLTSATAVAGNFFDVLGLDATIGRTLNRTDDLPGSPPVMVLGYRQWQRLGGREDLLGSSMKIEGKPFTVVGVAAREYASAFAGRVTDVFVPIATLPTLLGQDGSSYLDDRGLQRFYMIGRLQPGVTREEAQAEISTMAGRIDGDHPLPGDSVRKLTVTEANITHPVDLERMKPSLKLFAIAVALLLVITCANVAHLLLARSAARRREMGIRQSIGASRWRLVRQLLTENLLLAFGGGICGLALAYGARAFMVAFTGPELAAEMRFDARVLAASFLVCLVATLLFGLAPALSTSRVNLVTALKDGAEGGRSRRMTAGHLLSTAQVALCVVLLVAGALLARSLWLRLHADLGFEDDRLFLTNIELPASDYSPEESRIFFDELTERAEALPGVESAAISFLVPPILFDISLPLAIPEDPDSIVSSRLNIVDGQYFETMGIPLEQGRLFDSRDVEADLPVVVVSRELTERMWPGEDPLGRQIRSKSRGSNDPNPDRTVIGVVASIAQHRSGFGGEPVIYFPASQRPRHRYYLILRTTGDPGTASEALRGILREMDPGLAPLAMRTGSENRREAFTVERMQALAVSVFAGLGLLLAVLGIFGVLSHAVSRRVREVGIRMALGARRRDVLRQVVGQGMGVTMVGIGIGLLGTILSSRLLESLLFGISPGDVRVIAGVVAAVSAAAYGAAYLPARRASRLDPLQALRHE